MSPSSYMIDFPTRKIEFSLHYVLIADHGNCTWDAVSLAGAVSSYALSQEVTWPVRTQRES